jgi:hypothetical protein
LELSRFIEVMLSEMAEATAQNTEGMGNAEAKDSKIAENMLVVV